MTEYIVANDSLIRYRRINTLHMNSRNNLMKEKFNHNMNHEIINKRKLKDEFAPGL